MEKIGRITDIFVSIMRTCVIADSITTPLTLSWRGRYHIKPVNWLAEQIHGLVSMIYTFCKGYYSGADFMIDFLKNPIKVTSLKFSGIIFQFHSRDKQFSI